MKFLIALIISFAFLLPMKSWGLGNYRENLSDLRMQNSSIQYLSLMLREMDFLVDTKPVDWKSFWNDLRGFRYITSPNKSLKKIEDFYVDGGGDCDEFMIYVNSRFLQFGAYCGFMTVISPTGPNHAVAVYMVSKDEFLVVDPPLSSRMGRYSLVFAPSKYVKILSNSVNREGKEHNFIAYRVWWFLGRVETQPPIRRIIRK